MKCLALFLFALSAVALTQNAPPPGSVTVPITVDHNRVTVDVDLPLPDGTNLRIRGWVDNGNPGLELSRRAATLLGLKVSCGDKECSAPPPREIMIGAMRISLAAVKEAKIPLRSPTAASVAFPGMSAEINLPSTLLRNYDVLINFPGHEFTLAPPGTLKFNGSKTKAIVNAETGLIQIPSQIEKKKYNLALDVGASISLLAPDLFDSLAAAHPAWPHMTGAIGPANMWGRDAELNQKLMRIDRIQYGPLFLTNVPAAELPKDDMAFFEKRAGIATAGLIGTDVLANYRVGLDYAHSTVYFDIGRLSNFPAFDIIGLILRPEDDAGFTVLGIADFDGEPAVPKVHAGDHLLAIDGIGIPGKTLGQVLLMLGGEPGKERRLTIGREDKQINTSATLRHFLGEVQDESASKGKKD